jgi:hypothetical protein
MFSLVLSELPPEPKKAADAPVYEAEPSEEIPEDDKEDEEEDGKA